MCLFFNAYGYLWPAVLAMFEIAGSRAGSNTIYAAIGKYSAARHASDEIHMDVNAEAGVQAVGVVWCGTGELAPKSDKIRQRSLSWCDRQSVDMHGAEPICGPRTGRSLPHDECCPKAVTENNPLVSPLLTSGS